MSRSASRVLSVPFLLVERSDPSSPMGDQVAALAGRLPEVGVFANLGRKVATCANRGSDQTTSIKGRGGTTCSQMTISKILSLGHCRPHLGQRSGSRGTGGSVSSLMTTGCCHHSRQMEHGNVPMAFSSFFRRCLSDIGRLRRRLRIPRKKSVSRLSREQIVRIKAINLKGVSFVLGFFQGPTCFWPREISSIPQADTNQFPVNDCCPMNGAPAHLAAAFFQLLQLFQPALECHGKSLMQVGDITQS